MKKQKYFFLKSKISDLSKKIEEIQRKINRANDEALKQQVTLPARHPNSDSHFCLSCLQKLYVTLIQKRSGDEAATTFVICCNESCPNFDKMLQQWYTKSAMLEEKAKREKRQKLISE